MKPVRGVSVQSRENQGRWHSIEICRCPIPDRLGALSVLYRQVPGTIRPEIMERILGQAARGELDLEGLWIARRGKRILGAMMTQGLPGRTVAIWPPELSRWSFSRLLAVRLVQKAMEDYRHRGSLLAQALVDPEAPRHVSRDLDRAGLPYATDLIYLRRSTEPIVELPDSLTRFHWKSLAEVSEEEFAQALLRTYVGSLDMPELEILRGPENLLEAHRSQQGFDPRRWQIGSLPDDPKASAIVILSPGPSSSWEVSYFGLTPEARGRGLGQVAMAHAFETVQPLADSLELAVDVRNTPAVKLYERVGFEAFNRRAVHVASL